eukprot:1194371-Prorocentrum_minimum.AAC.5
MERRNLPHEFYDDAGALKEKFDGMKPEEKHIGLFEQTAGSVRSSLACQEMMRMATEQGKWDLKCNARVIDVWQEEGSDKYHILTTSNKRWVPGKKKTERVLSERTRQALPKKRPTRPACCLDASSGRESRARGAGGTSTDLSAGNNADVYYRQAGGGGRRLDQRHPQAPGHGARCR